MEKNIFISGPKSNYPVKDVIDKKNGHTYRHPIAIYKGMMMAPKLNLWAPWSICGGVQCKTLDGAW